MRGKKTSFQSKICLKPIFLNKLVETKFSFRTNFRICRKVDFITNSSLNSKIVSNYFVFVDDTKITIILIITKYRQMGKIALLLEPTVIHNDLSRKINKILCFMKRCLTFKFIDIAVQITAKNEFLGSRKRRVTFSLTKSQD